MEASERLQTLLEQREGEVLERWLGSLSTSHAPPSAFGAGGHRAELSALLRALREGLEGQPNGAHVSFSSSTWGPLRDALGEISQAGARQGMNPADTVAMVLALKRTLFSFIREEMDPGEAFPAAEWTGELVDKMALHTAATHQQTREAIIVRQQQELLELSTPVISLWDGILALPIIGTLDSSRTQTVMESLLERIVETGSDIAIIDITGVPTVDTLTAQHLLKTVTATRLMGGECIISGIRPQIAQTLVQLGVDLGDVLTRSTLAGALALALQRRRLVVTSAEPRQEATAAPVH